MNWRGVRLMYMWGEGGGKWCACLCDKSLKPGEEVRRPQLIHRQNSLCECVCCVCV